MYTEEELLEAIDTLIEHYGFDEDEAIELVSEEYEKSLLAEGEVWERTKELSGEYGRGANMGRASVAVGTVAGVGLGAAALGINQLRKDLKNARKTRKNIKNIRKTGRRLSEGTKLNNAARYAGMAVGAYTTAKLLDPAVRYAAKKTKSGLQNHDKKVRERNRRKEDEAILEYRKNKIKKMLKRR